MTARTLACWGTRGSVPVPGPATVRYGGDTACLVLEAAGEPPLLLDAGTGLRAYGASLDPQAAFDATLLLSHTHWDHIQGLPFFAPLWRAGTRLRILGPRPAHGSLADTLAQQMAPDVFPVPFTRFAAEVRVVELADQETVEVSGVTVRPLRLHHPGVAFGYRLAPRDSGREVAYLTDNELAPAEPAFGRAWREGLVGALRGVHTLVHDAAYDTATAESRRGWGHSTPDEAIGLARDAGCARLVLFHHEPSRDDAALDRLLDDARAHARAVAPGLEVLAAADGLRITL